jgi:hypothetical protein
LRTESKRLEISRVCRFACNNEQWFAEGIGASLIAAIDIELRKKVRLLFIYYG